MAPQEAYPMTNVLSVHLSLQAGLIRECRCGASLSNFELPSDDDLLSL